ncbi:hypothetical protein [Gemmobacter sp.]|uniref:hypothetical protein n=1 Tax=Gemmobacter sp. TaxID=1898957 RepID=UPI002B002C42|nr:hypothetical protein [Gemmobacter sp.]
MTRDDRNRLARLAGLAALIRDQAQADLARHAQACAKTRHLLAEIDAPPMPEGDLSPMVVESVLQRHRRWAAPHKARLNATLAQQTAEKLQSESRLRAAFGRAQVLEQLVNRRRD